MSLFYLQQMNVVLILVVLIRFITLYNYNCHEIYAFVTFHFRVFAYLIEVSYYTIFHEICV